MYRSMSDKSVYLNRFRPDVVLTECKTSVFWYVSKIRSDMLWKRSISTPNSFKNSVFQVSSKFPIRLSSWEYLMSTSDVNFLNEPRTLLRDPESWSKFDEVENTQVSFSWKHLPTSIFHSSDILSSCLSELFFSSANVNGKSTL
ncbi:hypothetical protein OGAPHI_006185 [Ogataea philodendri]|uniref:Uncharacterized protein n=1 Tax=Ogataea philodendri TaxID=1378263 RepID=A0A9P8NYW1_9ASCO|nr:uncharacterized protein OGAPHI_006185 [Ogataea philodendri]KAH3662004.1 hypothetical protein OGAPHI_006185 [Ogataea philodendri]